MKKGPLVLIVIIILVAGFFLFKKSASVPVNLPSETTSSNSSDLETINPVVDTTATDTTTGTATSSLKEFTIENQGFKFLPATLSVKKGDTVKITFKNTGGTHNIVIDEFNAATKTIGTGESDTMQFVVDKAGTFQYYCSIGSHRAMGMWGTLTVIG